LIKGSYAAYYCSYFDICYSSLLLISVILVIRGKSCWDWDWAFDCEWL